MKELEELFKKVTLEIRGRLKEADITRMEFELRAEGRVHDGEILFEVTLGQYGADVKGRDIGLVINEFERRHVWNKRNGPLELAAPSADDIPF
jgi:hypothetical protein